MSEFKPLSSLVDVMQVIKNGLTNAPALEVRKEIGRGEFNGVLFEISYSIGGAVQFINQNNGKKFSLSHESLFAFAVLAGLFDEEGDENNG